MSQLSVVSYNVHETLAHPKHSDAVLRFIEETNPVVGTLHSGFWTRASKDGPLREEESPVLENFVRKLGSLGYEVACRDEADSTGRPDRTGYVGFVDQTRGASSMFTAGTREGYLATVVDEDTGRDIRIGGMHMTDTDEETRLLQAQSLPQLDVLLADVNAMHRTARVARFLKMLRPFTERISDGKDLDFNQLTGVARVWAQAHILQSLVRMADGRTIEALGAKGLQDADPDFQPTIQKFGIGVAQLDHIMYDPKSVSISDYRVHRDVRLSDHWPISAVVHVNPAQ